MQGVQRIVDGRLELGVTFGKRNTHLGGTAYRGAGFQRQLGFFQGKRNQQAVVDGSINTALRQILEISAADG